MIDSLIKAMAMIGSQPKLTSNQDVLGAKSQRTHEQVDRLMHEAEKKRENRARRNEYNWSACRVANHCYKPPGQPSQEFCKYKERSVGGVIKMIPIWRLAE